MLAGMGVGLVLVSLYPVSQVFQLAEDRRRGDCTFAARHGLAGVRRLFVICYAVGTLLIAATLAAQRGSVGGAVLLPAAVGGVIVSRVLKDLRGDASDYPAVMRVKYTTSALFVAFIAAWLALAHAR